MIEQKIKPQLKSLLTFWRPAKYTVLADLVTRLDQAGFKHFAPSARTPDAALKDAIQEHFGTKEHRVEWLEDANAFEVVKIERGVNRNDYHHLYKFQVDKQGQVRLDPYFQSVGQSVIDKYNKHVQLVRATAVTTSMVKIAQSLDATSPHDGAWWLPNRSVGQWRLAATAVEGALTVGNPTRVYIFNHELGLDELKAVQDAIAREVEAEADLIQEDIANKDLKGVALKHRRDHIEELRRKIARFEQYTSLKLDGLKKVAEKADLAAIAAEILLSGEAASQEAAAV